MAELSDDEIDSALDILLRHGLIRRRATGEYELTPGGKEFAKLLRDPEVLSILPERMHSRIVTPGE
jgi:predicted transcriptional regulator